MFQVLCHLSGGAEERFDICNLKNIYRPIFISADAMNNEPMTLLRTAHSSEKVKHQSLALAEVGLEVRA